MSGRRIVLAAFSATLGLAAIAIPSVALGDESRITSNSATFADSIGEDPAAPDITKVAVSNDDAGNIVFQVGISNRPTLTEDMLLLIFLDTDGNAQTGDPEATGADYVIQLAPGEVDLFRWKDADYVAADSQSSLTYSYTTEGARIAVSASDLGKTKAIAFGVIAVSGLAFDAKGELDATNAHRDAAPDPGHGYYHYTVVTKLTLKVTSLVTTPKPARAGKPFSVGLAATESDTGAAVEKGTVTCAARIAGKSARPTAHRLANGVAVCAWRIPRAAKGKRIAGTITLTTQGVAVTRPFSSKIL